MNLVREGTGRPEVHSSALGNIPLGETFTSEISHPADLFMQRGSRDGRHTGAPGGIFVRISRSRIVRIPERAVVSSHESQFPTESI